MRHDERGQSLVELALVLVLMLVLALGIFELARGWYYTNAINNGVRAGLRFASGQPSVQETDDPDVRAYVFGVITSDLGPGSASGVREIHTRLNPIVLNGHNAKTITITASYNLDLITGNILQNLFDLSKSGTMPNTFTLERNGTIYYEKATF